MLKPQKPIFKNKYKNILNSKLIGTNLWIGKFIKGKEVSFAS